jgi:hypothetical protein
MEGRIAQGSSVVRNSLERNLFSEFFNPDNFDFAQKPKIFLDLPNFTDKIIAKHQFFSAATITQTTNPTHHLYTLKPLLQPSAKSQRNSQSFRRPHLPNPKIYPCACNFLNSMTALPMAFLFSFFLSSCACLLFLMNFPSYSCFLRTWKCF